MVFAGIRFVTKMGLFFVVCVFFTLLMFYVGLCSVTPSEPLGGQDSFTGEVTKIDATGKEVTIQNDVTGLSSDTMQHNLFSHYNDGVSFSVVMSTFFPCFTGILSGANRADILKDPPRDLKRGTIGAIVWSFFMYSSFMLLWGAVAKYPYLRGDYDEADARRRMTASGEVDLQSSTPISSFVWNLVPEISSISTESISETISGTVGSSMSWMFGSSAADSASEDTPAAPRRLAGGGKGAYVFEEIAWTPFPFAPHVGIIISSMSQALQCLIVAPRLLNAIARDRIVPFLAPLAPLSSSNEPVRALGATYLVGAALVLIGNLDLVAPLLTICFLVCYANMNFSCFILTVLKAPSWRPAGIVRKRWRVWYQFIGFAGAILCVTIMFIVDWISALFAAALAITL
jgi:amino acid transporter